MSSSEAFMLAIYANIANLPKISINVDYDIFKRHVAYFIQNLRQSKLGEVKF